MGGATLRDRPSAGPVEILCKEIGFQFDRRMEHPSVLVAFVAELLSEVDQKRDIAGHIGRMGGAPPSEGSGAAIQCALQMLAPGSDQERIVRAAALHDLCRELNPDGAYATDHLIDMVSSCASAIRFGLETPCHSRHAAEAANHVWKQMYGVSRFDRHTGPWEKEWARSKLLSALVSLVAIALPTTPKPEGEGQ